MVCGFSQVKKKGKKQIDDIMLSLKVMLHGIFEDSRFLVQQYCAKSSRRELDTDDFLSNFRTASF